MDAKASTLHTSQGVTTRANVSRVESMRTSRNRMGAGHSTLGNFIHPPNSYTDKNKSQSVDNSNQQFQLKNKSRIDDGLSVQSLSKTGATEMTAVRHTGYDASKSDYFY